jgi:uncharacterized membrane protein YhhN
MTVTAAAPARPQKWRPPAAVFQLGASVALSFLAAPFIVSPALVEPIWKAAGIVLLGLSAALSGAVLPAIALFASASGDFFLELTPQRLIAGMFSFAIAHLFFIAAFLARIRTGGLKRSRLPFALGAIVLSAAMLVWFLPDMGALKGPGIVYHVILTAMVVAALLAPVPVIVPLGAIAFLLSDTIIALGLYKELGPFPTAIWLTYAAAQIMLTKGLSDPRGNRATAKIS